MYIPALYAEERPETIVAFIDANPFGVVVSSSQAGLCATHLPLVLHPALGAKGVLRGHVARANAHHRGSVLDEALVIFSDPGAYITPSWYASKREHGRVVPTWNYVAVHVYGRLTFIDDDTWLHEHVRGLTDRHEAPHSHPWSVSDAPPEYIAGQIKGIVGLELEIGRIEAKWKMSQNRSSQDVDGVIDGLSRSEETQRVAALVASRKR